LILKLCSKTWHEFSNWINVNIDIYINYYKHNTLKKTIDIKTKLYVINFGLQIYIVAILLNMIKNYTCWPFLHFKFVTLCNKLIDPSPPSTSCDLILHTPKKYNWLKYIALTPFHFAFVYMIWNLTLVVYNHHLSHKCVAKKCPTNGWENSNWTISSQGESNIDYFDLFFHPLNMKLKLMCAPIHSSCS